MNASLGDIKVVATDELQVLLERFHADVERLASTIQAGCPCNVHRRQQQIPLPPSQVWGRPR